MGKYRIVRTDFWKNPVVEEEMTSEDKFFFVYLLTNPNTTQIGIYRITKKQIAFDLCYSIETVNKLMDRFIEHFKMIRYNPDTRELAIKNFGKYNLQKGGKPVMDCIYSELKEVEDTSLILYISESIENREIRSIFEFFYHQKDVQEVSELKENDTYIETEYEESDNKLTRRSTIRGQKEKQKVNKKEKQQLQKAINAHVESNPAMEIQNADVKEIIEFWDNNGFGFSNINAKQQLLTWLDDSSFLQPKQVILKAMNIACANNKRKLNYVRGILKNWEKESLLTLEEIDSYYENKQPVQKHSQSTETNSNGRDIPREFVLDLTAGED